MRKLVLFVEANEETGFHVRVKMLLAILAPTLLPCKLESGEDSEYTTHREYFVYWGTIKGLSKALVTCPTPTY